MLVGADAEHERAAPAGPDHDAGNIRMENGDPVGADHLPEGQADRLEQAGFVAFPCPVELVAHKVGQHFGVGLRKKCVAVFGQLLAELLVVLDDPVVDEGQPPALIRVGMRIFLRDAPVRCPAGVADSGVAVHRVLLDDFREVRDTPDGLADLERSAVENGDPGRIIPAVF